jgi:hypothetical protein
MIKDVDERRVKGNDQSSRNQTDRVEEVHDLKGHETCCKGEDKHAVAKSPEGLITKAFRPFLLSEENPVEKIDGGTHRAEPSAKKVAEDENEQEHPKGRKHSQDHFLLGEDGDNPDKRVESEIEVNRDLQLKRKSRLDDEVEKEDE